MIVPRETTVKLRLFSDLLQKWNKRINLVAPATLQDIENRHIKDSLQIAELTDLTTGTWVDLGSGGGFPGLVLAIAKEQTDIRFVLVESDRRKAAFLQTVIRETAITNTRVISRRIEVVEALNADIISARALAPLPQLMAYLKMHLALAGKAFLMKGHQWQSEVDEARKDWVFDCVVHPSRTQDGAAILEVSGVSHGAP